MSAGSKQLRGSGPKSDDKRSQDSRKGMDHVEEDEVTSPLKTTAPNMSDGTKAAMNASRQLFQEQESEGKKKARKRKSKRSDSSLTPDLNLPVSETSALVPMGLVVARVQQMDKHIGGSGLPVPEELPKKQKRSSQQEDAGSAVAAVGSPRRAQ